MARCALKEIKSVTIKRGGGKNRKRHCVVAKVEPKRKTLKTKGGGKLVDGGKRMYGCFSSASDAKKRAAKVESKRGVC